MELKETDVGVELEVVELELPPPQAEINIIEKQAVIGNKNLKFFMVSLPLYRHKLYYRLIVV